MSRRVLCPLLLVLLLCPCSYGTTLLVGEGEEFAIPHDAVEAAANGDTIVICEGTYRFDEAITLSGFDSFTIIGKGDVRLLCGNSEDNVCWITGCKDITIRNVHARHTNPTKDERCYGNVFGIDSSKEILIAQCEIHGCGAIGVYVYNSDHVELKDNHIHDNWFWAVQYEGEGLLGEDHAIDGLTLEGNTFENNGCQEGVVYAEGFAIASFIGIEDVHDTYFLFKSDENGDTMYFLVADKCEECLDILNDPPGYKRETMELKWEEVGIRILGTNECVRKKRIVSILVLH